MGHTPGPWEPIIPHSFHAHENSIDVEAQGQTIATVFFDTSYPENLADHVADLDTAKANAHLIAAAPKMLLMLKELAICLSDITACFPQAHLNTEDSSILVRLMKLVNKAEGKEDSRES